MNRKAILSFGAGAACTAAIAILVAAGPEHDHDPDGHDHGHDMDKVTTEEMDEMMEMSPEQMMAEMARLGTPGEHHKMIGKSIGSWHAAASFMMDPAGPPTKSEGSMEVEWVLGGRYAMGEFKMDFMGQPFEGLSIVGYDNAHEHYVSTWMDTMSTTIMYMKGDVNDDGELVMKGTATTPMGDNGMKLVSTWIDDNQFKDMFYDQMPDGTWFNSGSITYTRK
jgi:hypothetical protein